MSPLPLRGEKMFAVTPRRVKPSQKRFAWAPLRCKAIEISFFFCSEDAFCNWCLENAALEHPSGSNSQAGLLGCLGCEQVLVELVVQLQ